MKSILSKVPAITMAFWVAKLLTTGMGEVFSDFLVHHLNPILAVMFGFLAFAGSLVLQFAVRRYVAFIYWLVVVMVSIFGTMAADVIHIGLGIPYGVSTSCFAAALAVIFLLWHRLERTLSIHSIVTRRRELFYWATVSATFALGTAAGDMAAYSLNLGFLASGLWFSVFLLLPAIGYLLFRRYEIFTFWFAYIMTRPVGASFSDWMSKPKGMGGLGWGEGPVTVVLTLWIVLLVGYFALREKDVRLQDASKAA